MSDADVLALYWHTSSDPDAGAPILATLEAALEHGLAGIRPRGFARADLEDALEHGLARADLEHGRFARAGGLILGLELPGPHAVLEQGGAWWSWGEQWPVSAFPDAVLEEAWEVTWPDTR